MSQSNPIDVFQFVCAESLYLFYFLCYFYVVVVVVVVFAIRTPIIFLTPWTPWANQNEQCVFWVLQSCRAIQRIDHFDSAMRWRGVLTNNRWHRSLHIREKHRQAEGRWTQVSWVHMVVFWQMAQTKKIALSIEEERQLLLAVRQSGTAV